MNVDEELLRHFWADVQNSWEIVNGIANGDFKPEMIRHNAIRAEALLKRTKEKLGEVLGLDG